MAVAEEVNEAVQVSVPSLVRLNRHAASVPLSIGRILARQSGDYQSPFKGRGMEFDESRLYQPGDDVRNIDWRVTARSGRVHTKLFREERERPVLVWVDLRRAMHFATRGRFKSVLATQLAGLLAWSAVRNGDRVGGVVFSDSVHHELRPFRGKTGALRLIHQLVAHPAWQHQQDETVLESNAGSHALLRLRRVTRPGSMVFLMSDFRQLDETGENQIVRLSQHNEVVMIYIHDRLEAALPPRGQYRVSDGEREVLLDTFNEEQVRRYQRRHSAHAARLRQLSRRGNIRLITCTTEEDPVRTLQTGLTGRGRRD